MENTQTTTQEILNEVHIYVGTYKKYNEGNIFGKWITLGDFENIENFYQECRELHSDEESPEFMFQDIECPKILEKYITEYSISKDIFSIAEALEGKDIEMIEAFISLGFDLTTENIINAEERFCGQFDNFTDLAEHFVNELGLLDEMPENLKIYFDYEKYGKDLDMEMQSFNGYYFYS